MRTSLFLLAGFLLLSAMLVLARLFSAHYPSLTGWASGTFVVLWLGITVANMWVGVAKAGYSVTEELPILLLLFGLPAAVAVGIAWKAARP